MPFDFFFKLRPGVFRIGLWNEGDSRFLRFQLSHCGRLQLQLLLHIYTNSVNKQVAQLSLGKADCIAYVRRPAPTTGRGKEVTAVPRMHVMTTLFLKATVNTIV